MRIDELKQRLNAIGWQEQVDAELAERPSMASRVDPETVVAALLALAASVDDALLDELESEPGYEIWCLRLAASRDTATAQLRAQRYVDSTNWRLRHWARRIAGVAS